MLWNIILAIYIISAHSVAVTVSTGVPYWKRRWKGEKITVKIGSTVNSHVKMPLRLLLIPASILLPAVILCSSCALLGLKPKVREVSLPEYVNVFVEPVSREKPTFEHSLWVKPVVKECRPKGKFKPAEAFPGEYTEEFRDALVAYLRKKNRFSSVSTGGGDLVLRVKWISYRTGGSDSPRMWGGIQMELYHYSTGVGLLVGRAESYLNLDNLKKLDEPVRVKLKGERDEWIIKEGTLRLAEISVSMIESIDEHMVNNRKLIEERLAKIR